MTQRGTYILTAIAAGLYLFLSWAFADGLFGFDRHGFYGDTFFISDDVTSSAIFTYVFLALIVLAGARVARRMPTEAKKVEEVHTEPAPGEIQDPVFWRKLLGNAQFALFWLPLRFFIGREWLAAGEHKVRDEAWMDGGTALQGYWERAAAIPEQGRPSITYGWYREFLQYMLDNEWYSWFGPLIAIGEVLVGVALIVGALVGISAFLGTFMNFNFQLAGSASSNPVLFGLGVFLILAWKTAGYIGVDRYLLPYLGAPWRPGKLFSRHTPSTDRAANPA